VQKAWEKPQVAQIYFVINKCARPTSAPWINLGIASLCATLDEFSLKVFDLNFQNVNQFINEIKRDEPLAICFPCYIDNFGSTIDLLKLCKEVSPETKTIIGGPHVTLLDNNVMRASKDIDIAVFGEGERVLSHLIKRILSQDSLSSVRGISYRYGGKIITNKRQSLIRNLDSLPIPTLRFFDLDNYFPVMMMETSRGCPYGCPFCAYSTLAGRRLRTKSISRVLREIQNFVINYGIRHFRFVDATFTNPPRRFHKICKAIINSGIGINWCCFARFDNMTETTIKLAKNAGCVAMFIGIESGDHAILKKMHKDQDFLHMKKIVQAAKKTGIHMHGNFILGFPTEDADSIDNTVRLIRYLDLDSVTINPLYLVPQTDLHKNANKWGIEFLTNDWLLHLHRYFRDSTLQYFKHSTMTQMEMRKCINEVKKELKDEDIVWDMKDYIVTAWLSLGGNILSLKKLWKNSSDYLDNQQQRYFQAFKERGKLNFNEIETLKMKQVLTSIAQSFSKEISTIA
jgi:radical SAM superfamily enzyme YgiQ (UPF0313 family)